jgi:hypothetical protein
VSVGVIGTLFLKKIVGDQLVIFKCRLGCFQLSRVIIGWLGISVLNCMNIEMSSMFHEVWYERKGKTVPGAQL